MYNFLYNSKIKTVLEPFDYFKCTMDIENIDPRFISNYTKFNNKHISCNKCKDATLYLNLKQCATDANGSIDDNCIPSGTITSSLGNPISFPYEISPENISKFFCIS